MSLLNQDASALSHAGADPVGRRERPVVALLTRHDHEFVFESRPERTERLDLMVEGELPATLRGSFLANGAGTTRIGASAFNLFDAHGKVSAVSFENGKAWLRARQVATPILLKELTEGKQLQRRVFSNKPGRWSNLFDLDLANTAHHNVFAWGQQIVATQDQGYFLLDPQTLETRGPAPLGKHLGKGISITPMPRVDPATGRLVVYLHKPGLKDELGFLELDSHWNIVKETRTKLDRSMAFLHDVAFTEHYYIVVQWASLAIGTAMWGASPPSEALRYDPKATPVIVLVPRQGGKPITLPLGPRSHFHIFNAFERQGTVVLDAVGYDSLAQFHGASPPSLREQLGVQVEVNAPPTAVRYTIDLSARSVKARTMRGIVGETPSINPNCHGRDHRFGYVAARTAAGDEPDPNAFWWFHGIGKIDFELERSEVWDGGPRSFCSQPAFVARPQASDEDDGWLVTWVQDTATSQSHVAVLDARHPSRGPIARVHVPGLRGFMSHTSFAPDLLT